MQILSSNYQPFRVPLMLCEKDQPCLLGMMLPGLWLKSNLSGMGPVWPQTTDDCCSLTIKRCSSWLVYALHQNLPSLKPDLFCTPHFCCLQIPIKNTDQSVLKLRNLGCLYLHHVNPYFFKIKKNTHRANHSPSFTQMGLSENRVCSHL